MAPRDPKLVTSRGTSVPYLRFDEIYKHLGFGRRCDGVTAVFKKLYGKVAHDQRRAAERVAKRRASAARVALPILCAVHAVAHLW